MKKVLAMIADFLRRPIKHADWRPYGGYMERFHAGQWERRFPTVEEFKAMEEWHANYL